MNEGESQQNNPEWVTVDQVKSGYPLGFSIGRTLQYSLFDINGGPIKTACLRRKGAIKGLRLVNVDSLRAYVESCSDKYTSPVAGAAKKEEATA